MFNELKDRFISLFRSAGSFDDAKREFLKLVRQYHPDRNKDDNAEDTMKAINAAFDYVIAGFVQNIAQERKESGKGKHDTAWQEWKCAMSRYTMDMAMKAAMLDYDLEIEVTGDWIRIIGNEASRKNVERIKNLSGIGYGPGWRETEIRFKWNPNKLQWVWAGCPTKAHRQFTMDEIHEMYGKTEIKITSPVSI